MTTIITSCFETQRGHYGDLLKVFKYTASLYMPDADLIVIDKQPVIDMSRGNTYGAMTARLNQWSEIIQDIKGNIILADVDMFFLDDITDVFNKYDFDVAYTARRSKWKPINGGMVFIRDGAQKFVNIWAKVNNKMHRDIEYHNKWRKKYKGMNQPALGYLIENPHKHGMKLKALPCLEYNACDQEWKHINENTKVIHLKRALRKALDGKPVKGSEKILEMWRGYREGL
jgi:hypothetical protein